MWQERECAKTISGSTQQCFHHMRIYASTSTMDGRIPRHMEEVQGTHHMVDKAGLWELELNSHVETPCIERGVMSGFLSMFPFPLFVLII